MKPLRLRHTPRGHGGHTTRSLVRLLNVVGPLQHHPERATIRRGEWESLWARKLECLVHKQLAREVKSRHDVGQDTQLVEPGVVDSIASVDTNHAGQERVHAHEAGGQRRDLILGLFRVLARSRRGLQHVDAILRVESPGTRREVMVGDKRAIVEASRVMQRREVLKGVADGYNANLGFGTPRVSGSDMGQLARPTKKRYGGR